MQITRRNALLGATAAAVVAGVPVAVRADDAVLLAMEQEWLARRAYAINYPEDSDEVLDPLYRAANEIKNRIYTTPAQTLWGVAVKLRVWAQNSGEFQQTFYEGAWWRGDPASMYSGDMGFAGVMQDLERLAREG